MGSWPDWIAATFTSLAFVVAALSYRRSVKVRRQAQARLVYSKMIDHRDHAAGALLDILPNEARIGNGTDAVSIVFPQSPEEQAKHLALVPVCEVTAVIHNGSQELIGPAKVQVVNRGRRAIYDDFCVIVGAVDPDSEYPVVFTFPNLDHPSSPSLGTTVIFRDASGQWWRRHESEPMEAVHDDPENANYTPAEREVWAQNARAMGMEPSPEPRVGLSVRWHRAWRKRRGKSPIP